MTVYDFFLADYQHVSLVEYPGKISSIAFTHGCNIRCRYCHNPSLTVGRKESNRLDDFLSYLNGKDIEAVAVTGGEPLFSKNLHHFLSDLKSRGLAVKLDTNGFMPVKLAKILDRGLVDYVAVDLKSFSAEALKNIIRTPHGQSSFYKTIDLLKSSGVPFEVRHTMWQMPVEADVVAVAQQIGEAPFYIQTLRDIRMLDKSFKPELFDRSKAIKMIEKHIPNVFVR